MSLNSGEPLGHYKILSMIGKGGMGEVYQAFDTQLEREVAIKILPQGLAGDPERLARFGREAKILAALNHPNIATVHGLVEADGQHALVMELVPGETLASAINRGPMRTTDALKIARQIAEALEAAHEKNVVHRDLKPGNVILTPSGLVKVLDFGLATIAHAEPVPLTDPANSPTLPLGVTIAGTILGTASYMSPEQAEGLPADKRADIWSYGVVLWEMLTGQRLFDAPSASRTLADVLRKEIDFSKLPVGTPPAMQTLVRRCLDREVKNRLRDIGEARVAIDAAFQPLESVAPPPKVRSPLAWIAATGLLGVSLGVLAFVHLSQTPPGRPRIKVQVAPPDGQLFEFQLSPDGRFLAFITGEAFTRKIWIRSLDSLDARLLTDLPVPGAVFWSRDGQHIVFHSAGKLYKIARGGGPPILLADAPPGYSGGVWFNGGDIMLTATSGLFRIRSGGAPVRIDDQSASAPAWLPGGRFLCMRADGIFGGSLEGGKLIQLLPDRVATMYVPPAKPEGFGHLLFVREGTLWAQAFDAAKFELQGDAIPIAARGNDQGSIRAGAFTASMNGVLAFRRGNITEVSLTWLDRSGKRLQSIGKPFTLGRNATIRLSPNDSQAIVPVAGPNGNDLWVADLTRNTFSRFTSERSSGGLWSPDGRMILWASPDGNHYLKAADGSGKNKLLYKHPNCVLCLIYDWSRDGKLTSIGTITENKANVWTAATEGGLKPLPYRQSRFNEFYGMFSPDNRWMAYTSDESGQNQIFIESIPAGKGRWLISTESAEWPIWRRDGKELFYRQGVKVMVVPVRLNATSVETGKPQPLFDVPAGTRFQVSRDGQRFLIALPAESPAVSTLLTLDTDWRAGLAKSNP